MDLSYKSETRVAMLKDRVKRCVCKYCGKPLSIKKISFSDIDDARIEIFCHSCHKIEFGVEPEIYQSAKYFVEKMEFNYYPDLDQNEKTKRMNIAKICEIMAWENKNLGILSKNGFTVEIRSNQHIIGECVILEDNDLLNTQNLDAIQEIIIGNIDGKS